MTTYSVYNSYEEAKIDNPESKIVTTGPDWKGKTSTAGKFQVLSQQILERNYWVICDPSNHCMTVEEFLGGGRGFSAGDFYMELDGSVNELLEEDLTTMNSLDTSDHNRYVLRAAALEKPERVKVEYVKVKSVFELNREEMHLGKYGWKIDDSFHPCFNEVELISNLTRNDLFVKIETEITERDEFIDKAIEIAERSCNDDVRAFLGLVFDELVKGE